MKYIKKYESNPSIGKSNIAISLAKKLGYDVVEHSISKSIWEVDDEHSNSLTGFSIDINQNEINNLENKKLIKNVSEDDVDDYIFKKKNRKKILKNLELIRTASKYNL